MEHGTTIFMHSIANDCCTHSLLWYRMVEQSIRFYTLKIKTMNWVQPNRSSEMKPGSSQTSDSFLLEKFYSLCNRNSL